MIKMKTSITMIDLEFYRTLYFKSYKTKKKLQAGQCQNLVGQKEY